MQRDFPYRQDDMKLVLVSVLQSLDFCHQVLQFQFDTHQLITHVDRGLHLLQPLVLLVAEVFEADLEEVGVDGVVAPVQEVDLRVHIEGARPAQDPFLEEALDKVRTAPEQLGGEGYLDVVDQQDLVFQLPPLGSLGECLDVPDGEGHQEAHHDNVHHDDEGEHERMGEVGKVVQFPRLYDALDYGSVR